MANEKMRIIQLPTAPQVEDNDYLAIDNTSTPTAENEGGTRKIKVKDITAKSADAVEYDNTTSGLEADNVQDAIDEVLEEGGKVQDVKVNGVSVLDNNKTAQIVSYKEVTQAEYDALPSSKLTDGIMYCITDSDFSASDVPYDNTDSGLSSDNTQGAIDELASNLLIQKSIENTDIATFTDGSNLPMPSLKVGIEPIQEGSGDPSPTNVRPISGWSSANVSVRGVNQWDEEWVNGLYVDGVLNPAFTSYVSSKNPIPIKPNTKYYFKIASVASSARDRSYYDIDGNYIGNQSGYYTDLEFTTPSNAYFMNFSLGAAYGNTYNNDISINYPSTDTSYHAYNGQTYNIDLDGTRYGGSLDVVSGELVVDRVYKTLTSNENFAQLGANNVYMDGWTDIFKPSTNTLGILQCSHYEEMLQYSGNHYAISKPLNNRAIVFYDDEHATSVADFKAYVTSQANNGTPITVCYKLETPITYQLTPTQVKSLLGSNNVWCDTGKILKLEYLANATDVIASLDARITALENA